MSAFSTIRISRSRAIQEIMREAAMGYTDDQLGAFMDAMLKDRLYNVFIVPDGAPNDDELI